MLLTVDDALAALKSGEGIRLSFGRDWVPGADSDTGWSGLGERVDKVGRFGDDECDASLSGEAVGASVGDERGNEKCRGRRKRVMERCAWPCT
jgi:hypothetical protein